MKDLTPSPIFIQLYWLHLILPPLSKPDMSHGFSKLVLFVFRTLLVDKLIRLMLLPVSTKAEIKKSLYRI